MSSSPPPSPPPHTIRLALADDHPVVRAGVKAILKTAPEVVVVGEAADGEAALEMVHTLAPDILLLDLEMPKREGLDVLRTLQDAAWRGRTILLVASITREQTLEALQTGVAGLLTKTDATDQLVAAVQAVEAG